MKKVLFVFNHPAPYKVRLFNELTKYYDVHVVFERSSASDRNKGFYSEKNYKFTTHHVKGIKIGRENFISGQIIKHIKNNKYDLIVMNGYSQFAEMRTISFLKKNNIPYLFYINGGTINERESSLKFRIKKHFIEGAKCYLSPDEESNKYLIYYGAEKEKIRNYPYATIYESEIIKSEPNKEKIKKDLGILFKRVFVSSGQLIRRKNYLSLVKTWQNMPKSDGLYIFGDGKQYNKITRYIKKHKLSNVVLKGFAARSEIFDYYKASNGFVFPSKKDIYGHVINEALSQGLPIISTKNVNASLHLIKDGVNGYLVSKIDYASFSKFIALIDKKSFYKNCIDTASKNTIELMVKKHVEIFEEALTK